MNEVSGGAGLAQALWKRNVAAAKRNLLPGLILQAIALAIVLAYYFWEPAEKAFAAVATLKEAHGYAYSAFATALFGGVIPFLYLWWSRQIPVGLARSYALFYTLFWFWRGIEVDAFYRLQDHLFGPSNAWQTILTKVLVDQFVYCILWASPVTAILYTWKDRSFSNFREGLSRELFLLEMPSFLLATWIVWIPATTIIYSLPLPLQIPLFNLVLCFFVLLVSVLSKEDSQ